MRNLHTDSVVAVYQPALARKATLASSSFLALAADAGHFAQDSRSLDIYSYDLDDYNFQRNLETFGYQANPEELRASILVTGPQPRGR